MIIEKSFEQGSEDWLAARLKSIGGTGIQSIITSTGIPSKSRAGYLYEKASEIISGKAKPFYPTWEMRWGKDHEPEARDLFSFLMGVEVEQCAMIWADGKKQSHISPDGRVIIGKPNGLEIKCYQLKHFDAVKESKKVPTEHILQIQKGLAITEWELWWFMAYFPNLEPVIIPVERDENLIRIIKIEEALFIEDLDKLIKKLKGE